MALPDEAVDSLMGTESVLPLDRSAKELSDGGLHNSEGATVTHHVSDLAPVRRSARIENDHELPPVNIERQLRLLAHDARR
jgi:hypothetical protein